MPIFFQILNSNTKILNESLLNVDANVKRMVIAWWFYLTPHIYCCPFVCVKREERPTSRAEAEGASLASAESVNHGAVIDLLGLQPTGRPAEGKSFSFCSSRLGQPTGFRFTSLTFPVFVCLFICFVDTCKILIYTFKPVFR